MKKTILTIIVSLMLIPTGAFAQVTAVPAGQAEFATSAPPISYVLLAPLPCVGTTNGTNGVTCTTGTGGSEVTSINIQGYLLYVFKLLIALAVFLSVIMIVFGGFKYISVEAVTGKSAAKETITHAVEGLALALLSYLILYTVNPNLVNLNKIFVPKLNVQVNQTLANNLSALATSQAANQTLATSNDSQTQAAINSNVINVANVNNDQSTVNQLQNAIDVCNSGYGACDAITYAGLQNQLAAAQQQLTTDSNAQKTQSAIGQIDNATAKGVSTANQAFQIQTGQQNVADEEQAVTATAASATSALSNDPADALLITDTAKVKNYELTDSTLVSGLSGTNISGDAHDDIITIDGQIGLVSAMNQPNLQSEFTPYANQIISALQKYVTTTN